MDTGNGKISQRHGKGKIIYEVGGVESYEGEWDSHKPHGQGIERYRKGNYFVGSFYKGKKCGPGVFTYTNLTTLTGIWDNGSLEGYATSNSGIDVNMVHEVGEYSLKEIQSKGNYSETTRNGKFRIFFNDAKYLD